MSFQEHKRFAATAGVSLTWGHHKDFVYEKVTRDLSNPHPGTRAGFDAFFDAFGDQETHRVVRQECLRKGMIGPYVFQCDGNDLILNYKMENMEAGQVNQKIAMRSVGVTPRTPGMIGRLQAMAKERDTAILYCGAGAGGECIPIAAAGPWVLADGRVITNHFCFAKHLVEHYKNPTAAEKALEDAIAEESRKITTYMEEHVYPLLENTELTKEEAVVLKDHIKLSIRRHPPEMVVNVDPNARRYTQQTNWDIFCGDPTGIDPLTLFTIRQSSILCRAIQWVNTSCILPVKLSDIIPEVHICHNNFVYQIPSRVEPYIVFKKHAEQYRRCLLAVVQRALHRLSPQELIAQQERAEQAMAVRADFEARAAAREQEETRLKVEQLEIHRRRIEDERQRTASQKAREEAAWNVKWECPRPEITSQKKEEVRARQEARQERLSSGKQLEKAIFQTDKSQAYQQGLQRDSAARDLQEKIQKEAALAAKVKKEAHKTEVAASAAAAERAQVVPSGLTLADFLPVWKDEE